MYYYKKMFRVFAAIAITYTLLIEIIFIGFYWIPSRREFTENVETTARSLSEYTDSRLKSPLEIGIILNASDYTSKYVGNTLTNYEKLRFIKFIQNIHGLTATQNFGIAVTKYDDNYVIMNNETGGVPYFRSIFRLSEKRLDAVVQYFKDNPRVLSQFFTADLSGKNTTYVIARQEWFGRSAPIYSFTSYRESQLFDLNALTRGTVALFFNNELVASSGLLAPDIVKKLADRGFQKTDYIQYDTSSSVPGYRYVYLTEPQAIVTPTLIMIVACGLVAMTLSLWLMALVTRKMYTPIEGVLKSTGEAFTSGDEFAHIQSTIQSLSSNVETMSQSLEQFKLSAENKFLHELLTGLVPLEEIQERLLHFPKLSAEGPFVVVLIDYHETGQYTGDFLHGMTYSAKQRLNALLDSQFADSRLQRTIDLNFETQAVILQWDAKQQLAEKLRNNIIAIEPESGLEISAVIGTPCDTLASIAASYRKAVKMAEMLGYSGMHAKVALADDVKTADKNTVDYPLQQEQTLINAVIHGKTAIWQSSLEELIAANRQKRGNLLPTLALMLDVTVNRMMDGTDLSAPEAFGAQHADDLQLRSCRSFEELHQKALHAFGRLEAGYAKAQDKSNSSLAEKMLSYIHEHYRKEISLYDLADYLNLSRNYVSTLFKNAVGRNFKDYVGEYRFRQACAIIQNNPDLKLKEVADQVGCNTEILTRLFTRHAGMLPSDYQQMCKKNEKVDE